MVWDGYVIKGDSDAKKLAEQMKRFNRSIFGLMEMCNTGYWTPADTAQEKIDQLEEQNAILENTCHELRLERYKVETAEAVKNNTDARPGYNAWVHRLSYALCLVAGFIIGRLIA